MGLHWANPRTNPSPLILASVRLPNASQWFLYTVPPDLEDLSEFDRKRWMDVLSRSVLGASLLLDQKPGMLDEMIDSSVSRAKGTTLSSL